MGNVIVAKEPVTFTWHEIQWLTFQCWLIQTGRLTEYPRVRLYAN